MDGRLKSQILEYVNVESVLLLTLNEKKKEWRKQRGGRIWVYKKKITEEEGDGKKARRSPSSMFLPYFH